MGLREAIFQVTRRSRSVADLPVFFYRMSQYEWMTLRQRSEDISIAFGDEHFLMRIRPLGPREGSRGIFLFRERYEPLLSYGSRFAKPGDVVLDLGANQGIFCCAFGAIVGRTGRVIAVEPIPRQVENVRANIKLNNFTQCEVLQKAISNRSGVATLGIGDGDTAASIFANDKSQSIEVETTSIDEIVSQFKLQRVDFIKLDVEGAECLALEGGRDTLKRFRPTLSLEVVDPAGFQKIRDSIQDMGYRFFVFDRDGQLAELTKFQGLEDNVIAIARPELAKQS